VPPAAVTLSAVTCPVASVALAVPVRLTAAQAATAATVVAVRAAPTFVVYRNLNLAVTCPLGKACQALQR